MHEYYKQSQMEYYNNLNNDSKKQLRDYAVLAGAGLFTLWWFPINLIFVHLVTKAYMKDPKNLLHSFLLEFWVFVHFAMANTKKLYRYASGKKDTVRSHKKDDDNTRLEKDQNQNEENARKIQEQEEMETHDKEL